MISGVNVSEAYHRARAEAVLRFMDRIKADRALDVGCGNGLFTLQISRRVREVHGVDIAANAFTATARDHPAIKFSQMNAESLAFRSGAFDVVTCVETLEHLLNPGVALDEMWRVLKPGGHLIVSYPTINQTMAKRFRLSPPIPISEHLNEWNHREVLLNLRAAAFYVEDVKGVAFDFGYLNGLKYLGRGLAEWLSRASISIRDFPGNSMFLVILLRRS